MEPDNSSVRVSLLFGFSPRTVLGILHRSNRASGPPLSIVSVSVSKISEASSKTRAGISWLIGSAVRGSGSQIESPIIAIFGYVFPHRTTWAAKDCMLKDSIGIRITYLGSITATICLSPVLRDWVAKNEETRTRLPWFVSRIEKSRKEGLLRPEKRCAARRYASPRP